MIPLAPWFLWALPLIAAPILFHLFFKVRKRPLPFSSLMFFFKIDPNLQAKRQLRDVLLLALRVLIIACVVLALSQLVMPAMGGGGACSVVVVIDNSASMGANGADGRPRLMQACDCVSALISAMRPGDAMAVIPTVDDPTFNPAGGLISNQATLRAMVDGCSASEASGDPAKAMRRALAVLAQATTPGRVIEVFSDLQSGEWGRAGAQEQEAAPGVEIVVQRIDPGHALAVDVGIRRIVPPTGRVIAGRPASSAVVVASNSGTQANVTLRVRDDQGVDSTHPITVPPHGEIIVPVVMTGKDPGFHWAMATLDGDSFHGDDRAGIGMWCAARCQVVLLGPAADYSLLPMAYAPDGTGALSGLVPVSVTPDELPKTLQDAKTLLVLATWQGLEQLGDTQAPVLARLHDWIAAGGRLMVVPAYKGTLGAILHEPPWLGMRPLKDEDFSPPRSAMVLDPTNPCWRDLRDVSGQVDLTQTQVMRCYPLGLQAPAHGVIGLADGQCLFGETGLGSGHIYASGLVFHPSWSTMCLQGWSLAFLQNLALPVQDDQHLIARVTAGEGLPTQVGVMGSVHISSLAGGPLDWEGKRESCPAFAHAGVYRITDLTTPGSPAVYACVTSSVQEGVDAYLDGATVAVLGSLAYRTHQATGVRDVVEDWQRTRHGIELFPWLLVLAVLAWIAEGLVASRAVLSPAGRSSTAQLPPGFGHWSGAAPEPGPPSEASASSPSSKTSAGVGANAGNAGALLVWTPHLPAPLIAACAVAMIVALVLFYRRQRRQAGGGRAMLLCAPRALVAFLLLLGMLDPSFRHEQHTSAHGTLAVLVDTSSSMDVHDDGQRTRLERARDLVQQLQTRAPGGVVVQALGFDTAIRTSLPAVLPAGERPGDPGVVLQAVTSDPRLTGAVGVVALTDGGDDRFTLNGACPVPLAVIGMGSLGEDVSKRWNNIAISSLRVPTWAEVHLDVTIGAEVQAHAADAAFAQQLQHVTVVLSRAQEGASPGQIQWQHVAEQSVDLSNGGAQVSFVQHEPEPGLVRYRVSLPHLPGEVTYLDNDQSAALDVRESSLHVLYFTRELGVEFKTLRQDLARDPGVTFTALFRTLASVKGDRYTLQGDRLDGDQSLEHGFPTSAKDLSRYGCIVIGSFPAQGWKSEELQALIGYVTHGGAIIILGGEQSFSSGGYGSSPLADLMPWQMGTDASAAGLVRGNFAVSVPLLASTHPAMTGIADLLQAHAGAAAASVASLNVIGALKPGASALLEVPYSGHTQALVAVQPYAAGKVVAIATNTLWRLKQNGGAAADAYGRFWRQLVRYAASSPEQSHLVRVQWDKERYQPIDEAVATLTVTSTGTTPARVVATLGLVGSQDSQPVAITPIEGGGGALRAGMRFSERGDYRFRVVVYQDEHVADTYEKILAVAPLHSEGSRLNVDDAMLNQAVSAIGGEYAPERAAQPALDRLMNALAGPPTISEHSLIGGYPWYLALAFGAMLCEWIVRRRMYLT